jgi:phosphatidylglycerophosphatase A
LTTSADSVGQPSARFVFSHPAHCLAFGFGVGLSPVAPGTFGTLLAFPIYAWLLPGMGDQAFAMLLPILFLLGVWACHVTGRRLGVHDHGGMVWDETVAFLIVLYFTPALPV